MNVKEFQEKLNEVCEAAEKNGKMITGAQMREFFAGMELDKQQLLKILQYLKAKGITIEGMEAASKEKESGNAEQEESSASEREIIPLTPEEDAYVKSYLEEMNPKSSMELAEILKNWEMGVSGSREALTHYFMPKAVEIAVEMNCEEIFIADLIQEANLSLLMALGSPERNAVNEEWISRKIREGVAAVIEEQTQKKMGDDILVEKVQKLDEAIRELSEDEEDGESPFTIGELAVILDMQVDEIKDILRLAGENDEK